MTIAELERALKSYKRKQLEAAKEKASYDYILANLIGKSIARVYSSANTYPEIQEVYPNLFNNEDLEEKRQAKKAELSALRFRQFADFHNKKFKKGGSKEE